MAILYNESTRTFYLDGKGITYAFYINEFDYGFLYYPCVYFLFVT